MKGKGCWNLCSFLDLKTFLVLLRNRSFLVFFLNVNTIFNLASEGAWSCLYKQLNEPNTWWLCSLLFPFSAKRDYVREMPKNGGAAWRKETAEAENIDNFVFRQNESRRRLLVILVVIEICGIYILLKHSCKAEKGLELITHLKLSFSG